MRSKAHIKGHPIHAMLVPFPIAFLTATPVFDVLSKWKSNTAFEQTAIYCEMAGVIMAFVAAIPGIIDYYATVPPESSGRKRATQHGLLNITSVLIFGMALMLRLKNQLAFEYILGMEILGALMTTVAGWLGGTLLVRNQIGIDHRYANAGKWQEEYIDTKNIRVELKHSQKIQLNQMRLLIINGKRIAVGRSEKGLVAFDDFCTHRGGSLTDGALICDTVQCPWHGSQFNIHTGEVKAGPAKERIKTYGVSERNGSIFIDLAD